MKRAFGLALAWFRYLYEWLLLLPAARMLPKRAAYAIADLAGLVDAVVPSEAARTARGEAQAFGKRGRAAFVFAVRRLAAPRRELVEIARLRHRRERPERLPIVEEGGKAVRDLHAAGKPVLVVCGHFRTAIDSPARVRLVPWTVAKGIRNPIPGRSMSPHALRERLQNKVAYGLTRILLDQPDEWDYAFVGKENMQERLLRELSQPGGWGRIAIDAIWEKPGAYRRPFAGMAERGFALGAARIARLAQCCVVSFLVVEDPDGAIRVIWGKPLLPPPIDDKGGDIAFMDTLIDALERDVGRYPLQYLHPIGGDRRWDAASEQWVAALGPVPARTDPRFSPQSRSR
jgi:lauroyl/myristoyl acyltransferase